MQDGDTDDSFERLVAKVGLMMARGNSLEKSFARMLQALHASATLFDCTCPIREWVKLGRNAARLRVAVRNSPFKDSARCRSGLPLRSRTIAAYRPKSASAFNGVALDTPTNDLSNGTLSFMKDHLR